MEAFREPFVIDLGRRGSVARFWGQIRPGSGVRTVTVLRLRPGQKVFRKVATVRTDARGYWTRRLPIQRRAKYRFSWEEAGATAADEPTRRLSGVVDLGDRPGAPVARFARERVPRLLHRGLLALRSRRGGADGPLARARRALEGRPRRHAARPRGDATGHAGRDRLRRRRAAGRARRARRRAACSTASSSLRRRPSSRGSAASRGGSRCSTASTCPPRTAPTTSRCSPTCSSTSPSRCRCCARRRGWRPPC